MGLQSATALAEPGHGRNKQQTGIPALADGELLAKGFYLRNPLGQKGDSLAQRKMLARAQGQHGMATAWPCPQLGCAQNTPRWLRAREYSLPWPRKAKNPSAGVC